MTAAVIVSAQRTAVGTARKGTLSNTPVEVLAKAAIKAAVEKSGFAPEAVDDIILGEVLQGGGVIARNVAVQLGMTRVAGVAVNRHCASSLSTVGFAAGSIVSGMERVIVAGGANAQSFFPRMMQRNPATQEWDDWWLPDTHPETPDTPTRDMSITVGWNTAKEAGLTREEMDAWAYRSHQRAAQGIAEGRFVDEIVPINVTTIDGRDVEFKVDEHPRADTTMEKLASLKVLHPEIEGFSITAGNSSGTNDAAAALVLTSDAIAKSEGKDVLATVRGWTSIGIDPYLTGLAVPDCIEKLLDRTGYKLGDVKLFEINEAFASVPIAAARKLSLSEEIINISGSGCSIGHPVGASGARMITTLTNDLRRAGGGLGIAAMCAGGGMAGAVLIEV